jgi:FtsP/CotA-like multicopper oxidase with cupredoxin domain
VNLNRRQTLLALGASAFSSAVRAGENQIVLRPGNVSASINGRNINMLGYNGSLPGPEIRIRQNDILTARLENTLDEGTILHWHGIRLPNAMDGVNVVTQDAIIPQDSFTYRFAVPDAGTFWYHAHYLSLEQVARGLFGPLIVEEPNPPDVDQDITVQLFDVLLDGSGNFDPEFYQADYATAGRIGNKMMAFSSSSLTRTGERLRIRIINPAVDRIFKIQIQGLSGMIVALDGMPLATPRIAGEMILAPGQRIDVIGDVEVDVNIWETTASNPILLTRLAVSGARAKRSVEVQALPANPLPRPGIPTTEFDLVMQGGAAGTSHGGYGTWALNDVSGLPRSPVLTARRGDTIALLLRNETAFPHGIHLHGHHFWETDSNGEPSVLRDTTLVAAGETREILCVLDNPGSWLIHCHMLSHQEDGMATWIHVR